MSIQIESPTLKEIKRRHKEYVKSKNLTDEQIQEHLVMLLSLKVVELESRIQRMAR